MVHDGKAAAPSSALCCVGLLRLRTMDPNNVQRAVEVHSPSLGKELVVSAGSVSQDQPLGSPGAVGHRRSDRNDGFTCVLLQFARCSEGLYLFVGQCQVTRDQFSMEQDECPEENLVPSLPQLQGRVCLNCGHV